MFNFIFIVGTREFVKCRLKFAHRVVVVSCWPMEFVHQLVPEADTVADSLLFGNDTRVLQITTSLESHDGIVASSLLFETLDNRFDACKNALLDLG